MRAGMEWRAGRCILSLNTTRRRSAISLCAACVSINDADYPWLILVPRRSGVTEIADLGGDAAC